MSATIFLAILSLTLAIIDICLIFLLNDMQKTMAKYLKICEKSDEKVTYKSHVSIPGILDLVVEDIETSSLDDIREKLDDDLKDLSDDDLKLALDVLKDVIKEEQKHRSNSEKSNTDQEN